MRSASIFRNLHRAGEILRCMRETGQWLPVTLAGMGLKSLAYPCALELRSGETIPLKEDSDIWAFWQIFLRRVYVVQGPEAMIIDAGANIGFFALFAARQAHSARIVAIEPFPESYRRLCENIRKRQLEARVRCLECALGGRSEVRMMKVAGARSQARSVIPFDSNRAEATVPVATKTLEQIFQEQAISSADLLKMDIEGGEYEALFAAPARLLRSIRRIALEYHAGIEDYTMEELFQYLRGMGFSVTRDRRNREGFGVAALELAPEQFRAFAA